MTKKMLVLSVVAVMCCGCSGLFNENNLSVYGSHEDEQAFGIRAGTEIMKNLELGASANYMEGVKETTTTWQFKRKPCRLVKTTTEEEVDDWSFGTHMILRFPNIIDGVVPYAGMQATIGEGTFDIGNTIQPIGGVTVPINETISAMAEYQQETTAGEDKRFMFGVRLRF